LLSPISRLIPVLHPAVGSDSNLHHLQSKLGLHYTQLQMLQVHTMRGNANSLPRVIKHQELVDALRTAAVRILKRVDLITACNPTSAANETAQRSVALVGPGQCIVRGKTARGMLLESSSRRACSSQTARLGCRGSITPDLQVQPHTGEQSRAPSSQWLFL
jgi:hypothetical protein